MPKGCARRWASDDAICCGKERGAAGCACYPQHAPLLIRQRTMTANAPCALNAFGIVAAQGIKGLRTLIEQLRNPSEGVIPEVGRATLLLLARQWEALDADIRALERQIERAARADEAACRLMEVPSVGPINASAAVAKVPNARVFKTARDFVAWVELTPRVRHLRQTSIRRYLQTGRPHAAKPADQRGELPSASADRPSRQGSVAARYARAPTLQGGHVALSAKNARIIWALLAKGEGIANARLCPPYA